MADQRISGDETCEAIAYAKVPGLRPLSIAAISRTITIGDSSRHAGERGYAGCLGRYCPMRWVVEPALLRLVGCSGFDVLTPPGAVFGGIGVRELGAEQDDLR